MIGLLVLEVLNFSSACKLDLMRRMSIFSEPSL